MCVYVCHSLNLLNVKPDKGPLEDPQNIARHKCVTTWPTMILKCDILQDKHCPLDGFFPKSKVCVCSEVCDPN